MNTCIFTGRLTKDPDFRTSGDSSFAKFSLAVDRFGKNNGADFPTFTAFGKQAEFCNKYVSKGRKVLIKSHYQSGSYDGKDGKKVYTNDFIVDEIEFCDSKPEETKPSEPKQEVNDGFYQTSFDEGMPFA